MLCIWAFVLLYIHKSKCAFCVCFFRLRWDAGFQPDWWSCWGEEAPTHYKYSQRARNVEWWEMVQCRCVLLLLVTLGAVIKENFKHGKDMSVYLMLIQYFRGKYIHVSLKTQMIHKSRKYSPVSGSLRFSLPSCYILLAFHHYYNNFYIFIDSVLLSGTSSCHKRH